MKKVSADEEILEYSSPVDIQGAWLALHTYKRPRVLPAWISRSLVSLAYIQETPGFASMDFKEPG
jgi:hypothetical protein